MPPARTKQTRSRSRGRKPVASDDDGDDSANTSPSTVTVVSFLSTIDSENDKNITNILKEESLVKLVEDKDAGVGNFVKIVIHLLDLNRLDAVKAVEYLFDNWGIIDWDKDEEELKQILVRLCLEVPPFLENLIKVDLKTALSSYEEIFSNFNKPDKGTSTEMIWEMLARTPSRYFAVAQGAFWSWKFASHLSADQIDKIFEYMEDFFRETLIWKRSDLEALQHGMSCGAIRNIIGRSKDAGKINRLIDVCRQGLDKPTDTTESKSPSSSSNDDDDDDEDKDTPHELFLRAIIQSSWFIENLEIKWEIIDAQLEWLIDLAINSYPPNCKSVDSGGSECECTLGSRIGAAAQTLVFTRVSSDRPKLLVDHTSTLLQLFSRHPSENIYSALVRIYGYDREVIDSEFETMFNQVKKSGYEYLAFQFIAQAALLSTHLFQDHHVIYLESVFTEENRSPADANTALAILLSLAENRPELLEGHGADYYEALYRAGISEENWFRVNHILRWRGTISNGEAKEVLELMIDEGVAKFPAQSFKEDVLESMMAIAMVYPEAVRGWMTWIDDCSKDAMLKKPAMELKEILDGGKGQGNKSSKTCNIM